MYEILLSVENKLETTNKYEPGCWINVLDPSQDEISEISSLLKVECDFITAALDEEERPRIESEGTNTLILVDIPIVESYGTANTFIYSTVPIGVVIGEDFIVTVSLKKSKLIQDFLENRVKTFRTYKRNRFLLQLLYRNATYYLQFLKQIDKISYNVEKDLHRSKKNKELIMLLSLEKSLVYFSTSLKSNEIVLEKILSDKYANLEIRRYPEDQHLLEDVIIENKQAIEMANIYSNVLSGTMDAFASIISNNLNIVMKLLASITILMSVPNIVSGFFGMNVNNPLHGASWAFYAILGGTLLICILLAIILYKKRLF